MERGREQLIRWARSIGWRRRLLAAGLAAAAVALAIEAATASSPTGVEIAVAAHDLDGGAELGVDDLATATVPPDAVPDGTLNADELAGRVVAGPVRAGEPITDHRVVGPALLDGWGEDLVAAPVRVADEGATSLIRPGDRINLLAAATDGVGDTRVVASDVPVLTVTAAQDSVLAEGALLVVAATPESAAELAQAAVTSRLSFTIGAP
ncbi:hypothetical protein G1H11_04930 [Phytoactinopolyspora alkaliphila]|uniref:SAF domain-containing protein n=1 Tax=Phytoactinopolyspora alkaliphila TaxID=1783498 RepID=A0A6N9YIA9_9ACTN|nr:SAF domain-containing protein [Phytoactinopolyspora alkaliphila]NED94650.1 hypothetical protein [Phytoactinopolyspora alkaliphila]